MKALWPWFTLASLGAFHGLNPAMGWLFAVALGMHRQSRAAVLLALPSIALGHALSIITVAGAFIVAAVFIDQRAAQLSTGLLLICWAAYHQLYSHKHRVRVGMTTGLAGLVLWSFLMATAHGAGVMVLPAIIPLCLGNTAMAGMLAHASWPTALAAVAVHMTAMLAVTGVIALIVYEWAGLSILRTTWINFDWLWTAALAAAGGLLLVLA